MDAPGIEPVGPWQNQISPRRSPSRTRVTQNLDLSTALTQHIHQWHCPWRCCVCDELFTSISRPCRCSVCECMVHRACCAYELHLRVPRHTIYSTPVCLRCPASSKEKAQRADDKENAQQAERKRTGENQVAAALRKFGHPEEGDEETISFTALAAEEEAAASAAEEEAAASQSSKSSSAHSEESAKNVSPPKPSKSSSSYEYESEYSDEEEPSKKP